MPFLGVVRDIHHALTAADVPYAIIGGVAASRAGAARNTGDVDILTDRTDWARVRSTVSDLFVFGEDHAQHRASGVAVDVLVAGDNEDLPFELPNPPDVREWDETAGAHFMRPRSLVVLKAAVHLSKLREHGAATAAKDIADVYAILSAQPGLFNSAELSDLPVEIAELLRRTLTEITASGVGGQAR